MAIFVSGCDKLVLMASDKYASWSANKCEVQLFDKYGLHHIFRQHCRLSICENWLSWTNTETAAATPPTVMQNLLRASAQWLVLESAVFWLISPPTWVNWYLKMFLVHFTHYSGGESGNFVRNLLILSYNLSLKFGEALLLVRTEYWTNESFAPNLRSQWHIPQIWGEAPIGWILCADQ